MFFFREKDSVCSDDYRALLTAIKMRLQSSFILLSEKNVYCLLRWDIIIIMRIQNFGH